MPTIGLTRFLKIVASSGTPKLTAVRQTKQQLEAGYDPRTDFWKPARDRITTVHRRNRSKAEIKALLGELTDKKKIAAYPRAINGYLRFWGRKQLQWFEPVSENYGRGQIAVTINPELGLVIGDQPHLVKLHFSADPALTKTRVDVICHVMERALRRRAPDVTMSVLDVGRGKLFSPIVPVSNLDAALLGEFGYIESVWDQI